jgi:cell division septum initiation protein DivIVA
MPQPQLPPPNLKDAADFVDNVIDRTARLEKELRKAKEEIVQLHEELDAERKKTRHILAAHGRLMRTLDPLYKGLQQVYGDLLDDGESVGTASAPAGDPHLPLDAGRYRLWKERLPDKCAKVIDALLVQPMNFTQLKSACKLGSTSVTEALKILRNNKVIEKDGELNRLRRI